MDKLQVAGGQLWNPPVKFRHERWLHLAIDQHPVCPNRARRELWPQKWPWFFLGRNPWRYACRSIFSLVDLHVDRRRWRSILVWSRQLTSDLKRCLLFWKCLRWSSLKVVSVPTSVIGGLRGSPRLAILFILSIKLVHCLTYFVLFFKWSQPVAVFHFSRLLCRFLSLSWRKEWRAIAGNGKKKNLKSTIWCNLHSLVDRSSGKTGCSINFLALWLSKKNTNVCMTLGYSPCGCLLCPCTQS